MNAQTNEQRYFDALKRITQYMNADTIRRRAEKLYGLTPDEAIEMSHDNIINEAKRAIERRRRPK